MPDIDGCKIPRHRRKAPLQDRRNGVIEVGAAQADTREEPKIAAQGARYGPQVGRPGSVAPLADYFTDPGGVIVEGRRAELR